MAKFFMGTTAVVGATNKQERFGFKIYDVLRKRNPHLHIVPVNPRCNFVGGDVCLATLDQITEPIDTVVLIVNPKIGIDIVKDAVALGIKKFWFQPGAESDELRDFCEKNKVTYSMGMCLLFQ